MKYFIFFVLLSIGRLHGQVNISTTNYSQNFGTSNITAWTDNSTFTGWYQTATFRGYANFASAVNGFNSGGFYTYNCGSNASIGSRASSSAPNSLIYYGVLLRNTTGSTINSIRLSYTGYQMSLAENQANINAIAFDYSVAATAPPIAGSGIPFTSLDFVQVAPNSNSAGSASQLNWFPCSQTRTLSACIPVTILNNSYLLQRWTDTNDPANDHHMAIDDVSVDFDYSLNSALSVNNGSICNGGSFTITPSGATSYTFSSGSAIVSPTSTSNYTVTGTSTLGCILTAVSTVSVNSTPSISVNSGTICNGGSFTLMPSGASSYTFSSGTSVVSPSATTLYTVTGAAGIGCAASAVSTISVNSGPNITVNSGTICNGNSFTLTPSGAISYTFSSGSGVVSPTVTTSYTVTGTNAFGCINNAGTVSTVNVGSSPNITVNSGTICNGGSFTLIPTGAISYTYSSGSSLVSPTVTTNYTVTGASATGCLSNCTSTVSVNSAPNVSVNNGTICSGNSFTLIPSGANSYTFSGGSSVVSPSITASFTVTGSSALGCTAATISTITVNSAPIISVNSGSICVGKTFTIIPSGASTYTVNGGSFIVSPTISSSYTLAGTSAAGCPSPANAISNITVYNNPSIGVNSGTICAGQNFSIIPSGASAYTVQGGSFIVSPTISSSYTVAGTNTAGCISPSPAICSITVSANPSISVNSGSVCSGKTFTVIPSGASTYTVQGGSLIVNPTISNSYTVAGTSTAGCVSQSPAICSITVNANPSISVNSGTICAGQSFSIIPSGASTYTVQGGSFTVNPIGSSSYTLAGTNTAGCVSQSPAICSITVNANPSITVNSGAICAGQSFSIVPSGAGTYTVQGGSFMVSPTISSSYTVAGTSTAGCASPSPAISSVTLNANPNISVNNGSICVGQSFSIIPSGASTYTVQGGSFVVSPTISSTYTVAGTSTAGCISPSTAISSVTVYTNPSISVNSGSICAGQSFSIIPSGASTYTVQGGSFTVSPTLSSSYTVAGTSTAGCVSQSPAISNVTLNANPSISVNSGSICAGQSFSIIPSGASSYTVQGGSFLVNPNVTSSYTVIGTGTSVCVSQSPAICSITVNANPSISVNSGSICAGKTFTIIPSGANTYSVQGGSFFVSPSISSSYTLAGTSPAGCVSQAPAISNVTVYSSPTIAISGTNALCAGNSISLTASGALTYTWNTNSTLASIVVSPTANFTYSVRGTNSLGCLSNRATFTVTVNPLPMIVISGKNSICMGDSVNLSAIGANTYKWSTNSTQSLIIVSPSITTTYSVIGTSSVGCPGNTATINLNVNLNPTLTISGEQTICAGQKATLNISGANNYLWSSGSTSTSIVVTPSVNTTFTVKGFGSNGCESAATASISIKQAPSGYLKSDHPNFCIPFKTNYKLVLNPNSGDSIKAYSWKINKEPVSSQDNFSYTFLKAGNFTIECAMDGYKGCSSTVTLTINTYQKPIADFNFSPDLPIEMNDQVEFVASKESGKDFWWVIGNDANASINTSTSSLMPIEGVTNRGRVTYKVFENPGIYPIVLIARNEFNCYDTVIKPIRVYSDLVAFVPNAFTPNSDLENEKFMPVLRAAQSIHFIVFDRWGEKLFETRELNVGWDGTYKGQNCKPDVYAWKLTVQGLKGENLGYTERKNYTGEVLLIR